MENSTVNDQKQQGSNSFSKQIGWLIGTVVLLAALAWGLWYIHETRVAVSTDNAQVTGNIAVISPKISGQLEKIFVNEGDNVTAGEELAEVNHDALVVAMNQAAAALALAKVDYAKLPYDIRSAQSAVDKAQQGLLAAQDQVTKDQSALDDAKRSLDQTNSLYSAGAASREALDVAQSVFTQAQATVDADSANVLVAQATAADAQTQLDKVNNTSADTYLAQLKQAQAAYDSAKLNYDDSFIYAPISGTVMQVTAVVGEEMLGENMSADQEILSIADLQSTWVVANIKETDYNRIRLGQKVDVRVDAYPGKVLSGTVIELGRATQSTFALIPSTNDAGNYTKVTQLLPIKIGVDQQQLRQAGLQLMPGMSAEATIHTI